MENKKFLRIAFVGLLACPIFLSDSASSAVTVEIGSMINIAPLPFYKDILENAIKDKCLKANCTYDFFYRSNEEQQDDDFMARACRSIGGTLKIKVICAPSPSVATGNYKERKVKCTCTWLPLLPRFKPS